MHGQPHIRFAKKFKACLMHMGSLMQKIHIQYCLLKQVIKGKIKGRIEVTRRQGRRRKKLLDDLKDGRGYCELKEEALYRTIWRNRFTSGFGPVVWQVTDDDDITKQKCWQNTLPNRTDCFSSPYLLQSLFTAVPIYCSPYLLQSLSTAVPIYCSPYLL